ncbi:hypothetical protein DERF_014328 [Dermatophagoides farinae]|uniref:Uncharacterized protein n=1 Tax=Dermatophagoides farinae TaxID=6954 RepID=A0A922KYX4_DERFA|nr:hypothetical protein DERF_014328 [Dermatophagoides farinae]
MLHYPIPNLHQLFVSLSVADFISEFFETSAATCSLVDEDSTSTFVSEAAATVVLSSAVTFLLSTESDMID